MVWVDHHHHRHLFSCCSEKSVSDHFYFSIMLEDAHGRESCSNANKERNYEERLGQSCGEFPKRPDTRVCTA
ncbi:unnamed protein product [Amoebophrya sp. A120]|nr:unnamed protein product [Amoebophrya sp. A120]|eukprot:GSA120T00007621001.1